MLHGHGAGERLQQARARVERDGAAGAAPQRLQRRALDHWRDARADRLRPARLRARELPAACEQAPPWPAREPRIECALGAGDLNLSVPWNGGWPAPGLAAACAAGGRAPVEPRAELARVAGAPADPASCCGGSVWARGAGRTHPLVARGPEIPPRELLSGELSPASRRSRRPAAARGGRRAEAIPGRLRAGAVRLTVCIGSDYGMTLGLDFPAGELAGPDAGWIRSQHAQGALHWRIARREARWIWLVLGRARAAGRSLNRARPAAR